MTETLIQVVPLAAGAFIVALLAVSLIVPSVRDFALRIGAVQHGGGQHGAGKRVHAGAVPNIGGLAILIGFLLAVLVGSLIRPDLLDGYRVELLAIVLGGALMGLVGFMDDMWEIPPAMRLLDRRSGMRRSMDRRDSPTSI